MTGIKYTFIPPYSSTGASPVPVLSSRLSDLDQQMRTFIAEKRAIGLPHGQPPPSPLAQSYTTSINAKKSLPIIPNQGKLPRRERKLVKLSKKQPKPVLRLMPPKGTAAMTTSENSSWPSGREITRTEPWIIPHLIPWNTSSLSIMSTNAPPISVPPITISSPGKFQRRMDPWKKRRRPASFVETETAANRGDFLWATLTTPEFAISPQPWTSPGRSPLLPPPRGNSIQSRRSGELRVMPPHPPPVNVAPRLQPGQAPTNHQSRKQSRTPTTEILESVLGTYPRRKPRAPPSMSTESIEDRILSHQTTIGRAAQPPRTPPPPPTPAKSRAQQEAQRKRAKISPLPLATPVGFVAELEGSIVSEIKDVSSAGVLSTPVLGVNDRPRKRKINPSKIKSNLSPPRHTIPEGKEIYACLPLPAVPSHPQSRSHSPTPSRMHKSSETSPVIDIQLGIGDGDGLVQWFENFRWGEGLSSPNLSPRTPGTDGDNICILPLSGEPATPKSVKSTFSKKDRALVLNPDGAIRNGEQSRPALSPNTSNVTGLLSPVYLASPRLASCYGSRSSFASSAGDAFRFDLEVGEALSAVDEGHEEEEFDANELYQISLVRENIEIPGQQVFGGWELGVGGFYDGGYRDLEERPSMEGGGLGFGDLCGDAEYEGDDSSDTSNEFDTRLEQEIEMILNGTYGGGSSDDWRGWVYSADSSSPEQDDEREGEIIVGLDIDMGKAEERNFGTEMDEVVGDEDGWSERPRTRYIAGRNSMLDSDVIFCLRGIDSM